MPRCEGLPTGPCPKKVNNRSVKNSICDLFFCPLCEASRFPPATRPATEGVKTTAAVKITQVSVDKLGTDTQTSKTPTTDTEYNPVNTHQGCSAGNCSVASDLKCDVCSHMFHGCCLGFSSVVIEKLISIVDVTGWVCQPCRERARYVPATQPPHNEALAFDYIRNTLGDIQSELSTIKSSVLAKKPVVSWPSLEKSTKTHIVAAVHADFENSQRRKSNVIVHGLHSSDDVDDIELFLSLCEDYLHVKPCVVREKCRRLGKQMPGKIQPLLIALTNESAASDLLHNAKRLRRCGDQYTQKHVFINPDLTPAQARLAYERRERRQERTTDDLYTSSDVLDELNTEHCEPRRERGTTDLNTSSDVRDDLNTDVLEDQHTSAACPQSVSMVSSPSISLNNS